MKHEQPIITYRKNGQEITKTITKRNIKNIENDIFQKGGTFDGKYNMVLNSNIEYLYLKNITFRDETSMHYMLEPIKFCLDDDQVLILENCTFNGLGIYFYQGNIQLINPKFKSGTCLIKASYGNIFDIILRDENFLHTKLSLKVDTNYFSLDGCHSINIKKLDIEAQNIRLTNLENIEKFSLNAEEKIIFEGFNSIELTGVSDCCMEAKEIDLGDAMIDNSSYSILSIIINAPYIAGRKFLLISTGEIQINNNIYNPKNRKYIMLGKAEFDEMTSKLEAQRRLISCLKAINNEVEKRYEERVTQAKTKLLKKFNNQPIGKEKF